jgi:hypothetical protein
MSEWHNWADTQSCDCTLLEPGDLAELRAQVRQAAEAGQRIRPAGGSYSWAPLVKNEGGTIIDTGRLNRILEIDKANCTVEVETGVTIQQLTKATHEHGLTLITPPLFPLPTVGGTIGPGCHGTGWKVGNFSDQIIEMTIVKADGSLEVVDTKHADYHAAQVNLGTFGIIYSVKLKVECEFNVYADKRLVDVQEMLEGFDDLMETYEFLEMMWFPLEKKIWMYLMNASKAPADKWTFWDTLKQKFSTFIENFGASVLVPWVAHHLPGLTPTLNHLATNMSNSVSTSILPASTEFHFQHAYPKRSTWRCIAASPAPARAGSGRITVATRSTSKRPRCRIPPITRPSSRRSRSAGSPSKAHARIGARSTTRPTSWRRAIRA